MKKKIVINVVLALLIVRLLAFEPIYSFYFTEDLTIDELMSVWEFILISLGSIFIISFVLEYISRKCNIRILKHTSSVLLSIFLMIIIVLMIVDHLQFQKEYNEGVVYYTNKAKEEIENDKIRIEYFALSPYVKEGKWNAVDSIAKKYGVGLIGFKSWYSSADRKAERKYLEIVNAYLIERNGEDWRQRMDAELEPYIDTLVMVIKM